MWQICLLCSKLCDFSTASDMMQWCDFSQKIIGLKSDRIGVLITDLLSYSGTLINTSTND